MNGPAPTIQVTDAQLAAARAQTYHGNLDVLNLAAALRIPHLRDAAMEALRRRNHDGDRRPEIHAGVYSR